MSWNRRPSDFMRTIELDISAHRTEISEFAINALVHRTPEDTERAESGWTVGVGRVLNFDRGRGHKVRAIAEGMATISKAQSAPYTTVYISNNVPYIFKLEGGSSRQAPSGFFRITFNDIRVRYT